MVKHYSFKLNDVNSKFDSTETLHNTEPITIIKDLHEQILNFPLRYQKLSVPSKIEELLERLLFKVKLQAYLNQFLTLLCAVQDTYNLYSDNSDIISSDLYRDITNESKDFSSFLNVLEIHLNGDQQMGRSIVFNFPRSVIRLTNRWVIQDIYDVLSTHYTLQKEEFTERKDILLKEKQNFNAKKGADYIKSNVVNCLNIFFIEYHSSNKSLKLTGSFLRIAQIPTGANVPLLYDELEVLFKDIEVTNLRHYITRKNNFWK